MKVNALGTVSWTQSWFLPFLWEGNNISDSFNFAFAPKGLQPKAQGCRFGYPGEREQSTTLQPQRGCDPLSSCRRRNRVAVETDSFSSQGSRSGNPGL